MAAGEVGFPSQGADSDGVDTESLDCRQQLDQTADWEAICDLPEYQA
jgi:hypothetical protein